MWCGAWRARRGRPQSVCRRTWTESIRRSDLWCSGAPAGRIEKTHFAKSTDTSEWKQLKWSNPAGSPSSSHPWTGSTSCVQRVIMRCWRRQGHCWPDREPLPAPICLNLAWNRWRGRRKPSRSAHWSSGFWCRLRRSGSWEGRTPRRRSSNDRQNPSSHAWSSARCQFEIFLKSSNMIVHSFREGSLFLSFRCKTRNLPKVDLKDPCSRVSWQVPVLAPWKWVWHPFPQISSWETRVLTHSRERPPSATSQWQPSTLPLWSQGWFLPQPGRPCRRPHWCTHRVARSQSDWTSHWLGSHDRPGQLAHALCSC